MQSYIILITVLFCVIKLFLFFINDKKINITITEAHHDNLFLSLSFFFQIKFLQLILRIKNPVCVSCFIQLIYHILGIFPNLRINEYGNMKSTKLYDLGIISE